MHSVFVPAADLSVLGLGDFVWDKDQGVKEYPGHKCKNEDGRVDPAEPDINYHFRVYGPNGEGVLQDPTYGYFVVGTSHIDYRESCPEGSTAPFVNNATGWGTAGFSGESELAEAFIANEFEKRGYWVERDKIYLVNSIHAGHSQSNGMATVIHLG